MPPPPAEGETARNHRWARRASAGGGCFRSTVRLRYDGLILIFSTQRPGDQPLNRLDRCRVMKCRSWSCRPAEHHVRGTPSAGMRRCVLKGTNIRVFGQQRANTPAQNTAAFAMDDADFHKALLPAGLQIVAQKRGQLGRPEGVQVQHTVDRYLNGGFPRRLCVIVDGGQSLAWGCQPHRARLWCPFVCQSIIRRPVE